MTDKLEIRSYARIFDADRRIYRIEQWTLPVPGGVSLRALGWFGGSLLAVILLGSLPLLGDLLDLIPPPLRFLLLPAAIAMLATRPGPDGLTPVRAAWALVGFQWRRNS